MNCHKCQTKQHVWAGEPGGDYACRRCESDALYYVTDQYTVCLDCAYRSIEPLGASGAHWLGMLGFALAGPAATERAGQLAEGAFLGDGFNAWELVREMRTGEL